MDALRLACQRIDVEMGTGTFNLFNTRETGMAVYLKDWKYPVVVKENGELAYDNYEGRWGDEAQLNKLKAYYGLEKAKIEARKKGYSVYERCVTNGYENYLELKINIA